MTDDIDVKIFDVQIQRVYVTKFLGLQLDSQLTWKKDMDYTCKHLPNVLAFFVKLENITYIYSHQLILFFAYPYFIYCNHVWGKITLRDLKEYF